MQVITVKNIAEGIERTKEELYKHVDGKTVLFLSGGKTPKPLYEVLAKEKILKPAAVAMIDERYGKPMHENSNERMISETGLIEYLKSKSIPFYGILKQLRPLGRIAREYDQTIRKLFFHYSKSIGILGIGADGHTAGLPANPKSEIRNPKHIQNLNNQNSKQERSEHLNFPKSIYATNDLVTSYTDSIGTYGQRITLTFSGLSRLYYLLVFVFGKDKKKALQKTFTPGNVEEIPARFYQGSEISKKTIVITDQEV